MSHKIVIVSDNIKKNYELNFVKSGLVEYVLIDNIEYAVGYLFVNRDLKCPKAVFIDYSEERIDKFIRLCKEIDIDLNSFETITMIGDQLNTLNIGDYMFYKPISEDDFNSMLFT